MCKHAITIKGKRGHACEREQGGLCRRVWWEEREEGNVIIISKLNVCAYIICFYMHNTTCSVDIRLLVHMFTKVDHLVFLPGKGCFSCFGIPPLPAVLLLGLRPDGLSPSTLPCPLLSLFGSYLGSHVGETLRQILLHIHTWPSQEAAEMSSATLLTLSFKFYLF